MKIAVLTWGSLVWERRELQAASDFVADGPLLPIEFCRISRDGRLTLVLEGTPTGDQRFAYIKYDEAK